MTAKGFRLPEGGLIDRSKPLSFTFDGRRLMGFAGDTLASALLANGVHLVGRSFKYHRPRGLFGVWADEPNALVTVRRGRGRVTPNLPATQVEIHEGLDARSQNRWPSLSCDIGALNDRLSRFLPAGFYYKTFMWPKGAWAKLYEPRIRAAAGLGHAPAEADPDVYAERFAHCDVLVVGGGPAGVAAALEAALAGRRVLLCDDRPRLGGSLLATRGDTIDGVCATTWLADAIARLEAMPNVTILARTTAFGYYPHNLIGLNERLTDHLAPEQARGPRERLWQVRAGQVLLATGAIERPLVFPDNDRPGIMLADAARIYLQQYGAIAGRRPVVVTAHDGGYRTAFAFHEAGVPVTVVDVRDSPTRTDLPFPVFAGASVEATSGHLRVRSLTIMAAGRRHKLACDAILMCGGFTPSIHLASQSRAPLAWDPQRGAFLAESGPERQRSIGAAAGQASLEAALADGLQAGRDAAGAALQVTPSLMAAPSVKVRHAIGDGGSLGELGHRRPRRRVKAFVDWQNDVTARDIVLATREGFRSIEHVKRYTTTGMATDQGKLSNLNALAIVARETGRAIPDVGLTSFRTPYTPITFGMFAGPARGALFEPCRQTATHDWAVAHGAVFEDVGQWKRARFFPLPGEGMAEAVARECVGVRTAVGMFDASTLGKIELVGRDAAEFLDRLYVNSWSKLAVGRCRYGILLREDGFVLDDGVVGRIAPDRFHLTTTTGGAARVFALMEDYLQTEWPDLQVWITSTTEQWSVIAVQGPRAREVLAPLIDGIDISAERFAHMSIADGEICGRPLRLMRVSFTGELGFEVNVPSGFGQEIWDAIRQSGERHGILPYGTEAMHVLRAEKGYIIVGQETDGTVTPQDVGLGWAIGKAKPDFVGKRSLDRAAMRAADRKQLVGLLCEAGGAPLEEGVQLVERLRGESVGHVTSAYSSSTLGAPIALALVRGGRARLGDRLFAAMPGSDRAVQVVDPVFYDPEGARLDG